MLQEVHLDERQWALRAGERLHGQLHGPLHGDDERGERDFELSTGHALSNAIVHARGGVLAIECIVDYTWLGLKYKFIIESR